MGWGNMSSASPGGNYAGRSDEFINIYPSSVPSVGMGLLGGVSYTPTRSWPGNSADTVINTLYNQILGRQADQAGLDYYKQLLMSGQSPDDIAASLRSSQEFASNPSSIEGLYRNLLGRPGDADGLAYWEGQLASGVSGQDIAKQFMASEEYTARPRQVSWGGGYTSPNWWVAPGARQTPRRSTATGWGFNPFYQALSTPKSLNANNLYNEAYSRWSTTTPTQTGYLSGMQANHDTNTFKSVAQTQMENAMKMADENKKLLEQIQAMKTSSSPTLYES